jgi:bacterioferritin-associated ferredoxin
LLASGATSGVAGIGKALGAGTNCRSCLPELKQMVSRRGERSHRT